MNQQSTLQVIARLSLLAPEAHKKNLLRFLSDQAKDVFVLAGPQLHALRPLPARSGATVIQSLFTLAHSTRGTLKYPQLVWELELYL